MISRQRFPIYVLYILKLQERDKLAPLMSHSSQYFVCYRRDGTIVKAPTSQLVECSPLIPWSAKTALCDLFT